MIEMLDVPTAGSQDETLAFVYFTNRMLDRGVSSVAALLKDYGRLNAIEHCVL